MTSLDKNDDPGIWVTSGTGGGEWVPRPGVPDPSACRELADLSQRSMARDNLVFERLTKVEGDLSTVAHTVSQLAPEFGDELREIRQRVVKVTNALVRLEAER